MTIEDAICTAFEAEVAPTQVVDEEDVDIAAPSGLVPQRLSFGALAGKALFIH